MRHPFTAPALLTPLALLPLAASTPQELRPELGPGSTLTTALEVMNELTIVDAR